MIINHIIWYEIIGEVGEKEQKSWKQRGVVRWKEHDKKAEI